MKVVIDASFSAAWFLPDEQSPPAEQILEGAISGRKILCVPSLWDYEMSNLLLMAIRRKRLPAACRTEVLELLASLPIKHRDHPDSLTSERIFDLAQTHSLSAYDAAYLELADRFRCPLITSDAKLQAAAAARTLPTL